MVPYLHETRAVDFGEIIRPQVSKRRYCTNSNEGNHDNYVNSCWELHALVCISSAIIQEVERCAQAVKCTSVRMSLCYFYCCCLPDASVFVLFTIMDQRVRVDTLAGLRVCTCRSYVCFSTFMMNRAWRVYMEGPLSCSLVPENNILACSVPFSVFP